MGGGERGRQLIILPNFSRKLHENENNWIGRGASLLGSASGDCFKNTDCSMNIPRSDILCDSIKVHLHRVSASML